MRLAQLAMLLASCGSPPQPPSTARGGSARAPAPTAVVATPGPMRITSFVTVPGQPAAGPRREYARCENVCGPSVVTLTWEPAAGAIHQRIQMARAPSEFVPEVVLESQDLDPTISELEWRVLYAGTRNYWRTISDTASGWIASPAREFQAAGCMQCDERPPGP